VLAACSVLGIRDPVEAMTTLTPHQVAACAAFDVNRSIRTLQLVASALGDGAPKTAAERAAAKGGTRFDLDNDPDAISKIKAFMRSS